METLLFRKREAIRRLNITEQIVNQMIADGKLTAYTNKEGVVFINADCVRQVQRQKKEGANVARRKDVKKRLPSLKRLNEIRTVNDTNYVYLMYCADTDLHKIGRSTNPHKRLYELNRHTTLAYAKTPSITLVGYWQAARSVEADLHLRFGLQRTVGEWFRLTERDVYWIKEFCSTVEANQ